MKSLFELTLLLALFLGVATPSAGAAPAPMERVKQELQSGGELYFLFGPTTLKRHLSELYLALERGIAGSELPDREHTQRLLAVLRAMIRMSGVPDVAAAGCSSVPDATFGFSNRTAVAAPPGKSSGWLWRTHGKAEPRLARIGGFPADTAFALDFGVDLLPMLKDIDASGYGKLIAECLDDFAMLSPADWLKSLSGDWQIAAAIPEGQRWDHDSPFLAELKKCDIYLSIPDNQGKLKTLLELFCAENPSAARTENVIYISDGDNSPTTMVIVLLERRILYFSSLRCFEKFGSGSANFKADGRFVPDAKPTKRNARGKTLADDPRFAAALERLSGNSHGAYFSCDAATGGILRIGGKGKHGFQLKLPDDAKRSVGVWNADDGMIVTRELATESLALQTFDTLIGTPLLLVADRLLQRPPKAPPTAPAAPAEETKPSDEEPRKAAAAAQKTAECRENLLKIGRLVNDHAASHDGKLPATLPGDHRCGDSGYLYFGPFSAPPSGKMPLVADPVGGSAHPGTVNVLFVDGSVESFEFDAASVKRLCSFLHTVYRYDEKEFIRLMERASQLDEKKGKRP